MINLFYAFEANIILCFSRWQIHLYMSSKKFMFMFWQTAKVQKMMAHQSRSNVWQNVIFFCVCGVKSIFFVHWLHWDDPVTRSLLFLKDIRRASVKNEQEFLDFEIMLDSLVLMFLFNQKINIIHTYWKKTLMNRKLSN